MGCDSSIHEAVAMKPVGAMAKPSKIGVISLKITDVFLHQSANSPASESELILRMQVSNQFQELVVKDINLTPGQQTVCTFYINSLSKLHGRTLTMEIWNIKDTESQVGFGVFDLQPFINPVKKRSRATIDVKKAENKCFLNYEHRPAGFVELEPLFKAEQYVEISFRLCSAQIRKPLTQAKTCFARVIVGEDIYQSPPLAIDNRRLRLEFQQNKIIKFKVPSSLQTGVIQLISKVGNSDNLLGCLNLDLKLMSEKQLQIDEQLVVEGEDEIFGSISMLSIPTLKQIPSTNQSLEVSSPRRNKKNGLTSIENIEVLESARDLLPTNVDKDNKNTDLVAQVRKNSGLQKMFENLEAESIKKYPSVQKLVPADQKPDSSKDFPFETLEAANSESLQRNKNTDQKDGESIKQSMPPVQVQQAMKQFFHKRALRRSICL